MNTDANGGRNRFFRWLLLLVAVVQLAGCGTDSPQNSQTAAAITSADNTTFAVGTAGTFSVTATGSPAPTFALTGTLPSGVTFDARTGVLSGTPAAGSSGSYPLTITASNGVSPNATQSFTLTVNVASTAVLIVHDGTAAGYLEARVVSNLSAIVTAAGLTPSTSVGIPSGSLSGYTQIWDVRYDITTPLTAEDIASYTTYLAGGGTLVVIGENTGFATRNDTIVSLISSLGGGSITVAEPNSDTQAVQAPFTGPNPITSVTFLSAAGTANAGTGAFITKDSGNIGAGIIYSPGTLSGAPAGRLLVVFDVNFLDSSADAASKSLTANIIGTELPEPE